ncbi:adenylate kinase [Salinispirillum sp. LH 10-3-1]|uniref:Adenylate kinase n=1 Tax=Salinispirillum sp. LH 10-3-1 TaxID=2952525 RepID=A0AB38YFT8_9GAMM
MQKVAIFGNAGGGKSTLAKQLAEAAKLPLYSLDKIKYQAGGKEVPHTEYLRTHSDLLSQEAWIIDGFGCVPSAWERFAAADTLIFIDLPLLTHGLWVTKRLLKGSFVNPEGWPENSPILKGTLNSYRVLWLCHTKLTPAYRKLVSDSRNSKSVYHLRSPRAIKAFLNDIRSK